MAAKLYNMFDISKFFNHFVQYFLITNIKMQVPKYCLLSNLYQKMVIFTLKNILFVVSQDFCKYFYPFKLQFTMILYNFVANF